MVVIETSVFAKQVQNLLSAEEYRQMQAELITRPEMGVVIPQSGGLRKIRWSAKGHGKRGGARVIYYWAVIQDQLLLLLIYPKNMQDDLTQAQVKMLRQIVEAEYP